MNRLLNNRGGTTSRVLYGVLGAFSLIFALIMGIVAIVYGAEEVYDAGDLVVVFIFLFIGFVLGAEGVLMFMLPARMERMAAERVATVRTTPDLGDTVPPTPVSEFGRGAPVTEPHMEADPQPAATSTQEDTAHMLLRSDDIFATARDIVRSQQTNPSSARNLTHLASMLAPLDLAHWDAAPTCSVSRLSRTRNYWLRANASELSGADYDRYVAAEAALNIDLALPQVAHLPQSGPGAAQATGDFLRTFVDQKANAYDFTASMDRAYPAGWSAQDASEWLLRASIVNDAECVRLPFRLPYELRANAQQGVAVLSLEIPRPACFCIVCGSRTGRIAHARAYALRLAWLIASHALDSVASLQRLEIICHEHESQQPLLCVSFTRDFVKRLAPVVHGTGIDEHGFPQDEAIHVAFDENNWFAPVEAPLSLTSEAVAPQAWFAYPELDSRALGPRAQEACGSARVCDLAINENGPRANAADALIARWHGLEARNCENVVSTLVDLRNESPDVSIAEACERTTAALLDGSIDPTDDDALRQLFVSDGALQDAALRASRLLDGDSPDPEQAVSILTQALEPLLSFGFYADDETRIYRYFGSTAERLVFNARMDDHSREVRLVPDSYYNALGLLASANVALGKLDDALDAANEMMRIGPASVDAAMRKVRALENQQRIFEAAELIKAYAAIAATPRDAALAHYRLAYMEWKLGREDLAVACYQRALTWDTPLSSQASEELDDLLGAESHLKRLEPAEVERLLTSEGIPLGFSAADQDLLLTASTLLTDEHAFRVAQPILAVLCAAEGDDVLVGIRRSLEE